jgi:hypothetical protein
MSRRRREADDLLVVDSEDEEVPAHAARKQRLAPDWPAGTILEVRRLHPRLRVAAAPRLGLQHGASRQAPPPARHPWAGA